MSDDLSQLRSQIDALDREILSSLNARAALARRVGSLKVGQAYRPEREAEVLRRIQKLNQGPLPDEVVARFFREIMSACLALERPVTVAYLGPPGTVRRISYARFLAGEVPAAEFEGKERAAVEISQLIFFTQVLMLAADVSLEDVYRHL